MSSSPSSVLSEERKAEILRLAKGHARPSTGAGAWQLGVSFAAFALSWYLAASLARTSLVAMAAAQLVAAGFWVRLFILQHDLGHRTLFASRRTNDIVGSILGVITLMPHQHWRRLHNIHHRDWAKIDHRGPGYITTITVREYRERSPLGRWVYRMYRNPAVVILLGGFFYFGFNYRIPTDAERHWKLERRSVYLTNLGIAACFAGLGYLVGPMTFVLVHGPIFFVATMIVMWFFLVQHNYERTYWRSDDRWDFVDAALVGSSYYKLPRPLQWLTANVGLHHVHHIAPRIPNYRLQRCLDDIPELGQVAPLSTAEQRAIVHLALWDEDQDKLVRFRDVALAPEPPLEASCEHSPEPSKGQM